MWVFLHYFHAECLSHDTALFRICCDVARTFGAEVIGGPRTTPSGASYYISIIFISAASHQLASHYDSLTLISRFQKFQRIERWKNAIQWQFSRMGYWRSQSRSCGSRFKRMMVHDSCWWKYSLVPKPGESFLSNSILTYHYVQADNIQRYIILLY